MKLFPQLISESPAGYGSRVRVLSPEVAHRIAAGEVIECLASAVKELVENALDAGASRVEVEIEGGGVSLLRVRDDGSGMYPGDAERAVGRHATSKISCAEDLARVLSLGFRGEALHAISSVSALPLTTRTIGETHATRVQVIAGAPGTLTRRPPGRHDGRGTRSVHEPPCAPRIPRDGAIRDQRGRNGSGGPGSEPSRSRLLPQGGWPQPLRATRRRRPAGAGGQVHGLSLARSLVPLYEVVGGPVWGLVSPLSVSFPTRRYLHVAVNGRVVDTDSFAPAVAKAYADLLPKGRHPAAFLRLDLGPGEVDVNVHPAKSAVRLRGGRSAYPLVVHAIRSALAPEREEVGAGPALEGDDELRPIGQFAGRCIIV